MRTAPLDTPDFLTLAAQRLRPEPPALGDALANPRGDHSLDDVPLVHPLTPKEAAVLVPVVMREEPTLLFTERATSLRQHSGQIAFPGGRVDPTDESVLAAAYREAQEEIGLDNRFISPLGYLDPYLSTTNYLVIPVVARVAPSYTLVLNPDEVADTFEVPLSFLMEPANHQLHAREWQGIRRRYYAMPYEGRYIWGVTAGILRNLYERLYMP
ncbi:CoA pyrophosphatase [Microvirga sp. 17 mud 1-3]|uniref:CoA pyrophosphatase n=1 Tax=Microvirga sp. 17 mud 1-3 TaxID=2082949 RepID=UPI000D6D0F88|nr:CoA pyrophosphatase [Microvirga sp. 17 mud 1-3]AWM86165.1 CoA pyrophosphatase [Microvirga sp. 17 mud 1-3]